MHFAGKLYAMQLPLHLPAWMPLAFASSGYVQTTGCTGAIQRRALADIILPTGRIACGYPGESWINQQSTFFPQVTPGRYPVFITVAQQGDDRSFAFLTIQFADAVLLYWNPVGAFFTDSGDGVVYDASLTDALSRCAKSDAEQRNQWRDIQRSSLFDGDGNFVIDQETGSNAIIFHTHDSFYPIYTGHDEQGEIVCLVVDGHSERPHRPSNNG